MPVFFVLGEELAADRLVDLAQHRFDVRLQILVRLVAAHFGNHWFEQAEAITQLLRRCAHGRINVACCQAVYRQSVNEP